MILTLTPVFERPWLDNQVDDIDPATEADPYEVPMLPDSPNQHLGWFLCAPLNEVESPTSLQEKVDSLLAQEPPLALYGGLIAQKGSFVMTQVAAAK